MRGAAVVSTLSRSGVLVVDKPAGVTSFDVVSAARRGLRVRRIGHAGTLDPPALGVLPLLIGEATKLTPFLGDQDKEYVATVRFGLTTDTHDMTGRVLSEAGPPILTREILERAGRHFVGRIRQVPPMYSAVHHEGRRLYELARAGVEVDRESREVWVRSITVDAVEESRATLRVVCGKGTYIRVLAADLGKALGCGATLERLVRSRVGPFDLSGAVEWRALTEDPPDALWFRVLPPEAALPGWPAVRLEPEVAAAFTHGQAVEGPAPAADGSLVRVHDRAGRLVGVGAATAGGNRIRPLRILHADRPGTRVLPA